MRVVGYFWIVIFDMFPGVPIGYRINTLIKTQELFITDRTITELAVLASVSCCCIHAALLVCKEYNLHVVHWITSP